MASRIKEIEGERYLNMEACQERFNISPQGWRNTCKRLNLKKWIFKSVSRSVFIKESDVVCLDSPEEK